MNKANRQIKTKTKNKMFLRKKLNKVVKNKKNLNNQSHNKKKSSNNNKVRIKDLNMNCLFLNQ